ncbi:IS30 family transposase, partial [Magnetovibrio sp. PR-2]|uniref:IS30 family transposase n=1 Tax=Magnetovibrio sp. PR-2 TaxID=3120356 RepID=UPI002FCDE26F
MGTQYNQLNLTERIEIYRLHSSGQSLRAIGACLGRAPSTISRELSRNSRKTKAWPGGYRPERADDLAARRRRWDKRFKLVRQPHLQAYVRDRLAMGWSPQQIAGRLARDNAPIRISPESIYRYIYHRTEQKDYLNRLLPWRKGRRGKIARGGMSSLAHIKNRKGLELRPQDVEGRKTFGHWEADTMLFSRYGQNVLVIQERRSRLVLAVNPGNRKAANIENHLHKMLQPLPPHLRQTITFDNGVEFAQHHELARKIGIETYFCDRYAPWQKGGVENAILRLRRALPRKTNLADIADQRLDEIVRMHNNTPRKCLDYKTPAEVFCQILNPLHFKRDSI